MTTSKGFSFPAYSSKPFSARDPDLALPLVWAGEVQHGIKSWQSLDGCNSKETLCYWNIPEVEIRNTDSTARQPNRKQRRRSKYFITTTSILWVTKNIVPHKLHLPLSGLLSENKALPLAEGFIGRGSQAMAVTNWADLLPYYTGCTAFHSTSASPPARITNTVSQIYMVPHINLLLFLFLSVIKVGLPANNLLFHKSQISGRYSTMKPTQVVLLWNNFLLEELSSYQKSPVCTESFTLWYWIAPQGSYNGCFWPRVHGFQIRLLTVQQQ